MKNILSNLIPQQHAFLQRFENGWHTFLISPAHYWKYVVIVFIVIFIIILGVDLFLFWHLASTPPETANNAGHQLLELNEKELDSALVFLHEREEKYHQLNETTFVREIFQLPEVTR